MSKTDALEEAFKILDCDQDGFISVDDLRCAMEMFESDSEEENSNSRKERDDEKVNEDEEEEEGEDEELKEMIAEADSDGDGKISFDDFLKVLETPVEKHDNEVKIKKTKTKANGNSRIVK